MSQESPSPKHRALEFVLWGGVVLVGGFVLLPFAVELVQTRQQELQEQQTTQDLEQKLIEEQERLELFGHDPDAARKKAELLGIQERKENLEEDTND